MNKKLSFVKYPPGTDAAKSVSAFIKLWEEYDKKARHCSPLDVAAMRKGLRVAWRRHWKEHGRLIVRSSCHRPAGPH